MSKQCKKGIVLAGGVGSRLHPLTLATNKQFLPVYDKPAIYYPLTTLMLAGISEILIISTPKDIPALRDFLGTGEQFGVTFSYQVQEAPKGLPEAFILGEDFINNEPVALILGDNFYHGHGLSEAVFEPAQSVDGVHLFVHKVEDPERYGVVELDSDGKPISLEEKPLNPRSRLAVTGLYFFDGTVSQRSKSLMPSKRGELEITDLIKTYMEDGSASLTELGRGFVWFDVGTPKSLLDASNYVEMIQSRQGVLIASPEEVAWRMGFISKERLHEALSQMPMCSYKKYLEGVLDES